MKIIKWSIGIWVLVLFLGGNAYTSAREIAIISNRAYPASSITMSGVQEIYLGEKLTEGGVKIRPVDQNDEPIKKKFIEKVMGRKVDHYKAYWIKKFFQEGITPPVARASAAEVIQVVSQTSGGVGYVWADEVKGDVKVLLKIEVGN